MWQNFNVTGYEIAQKLVLFSKPYWPFLISESRSIVLLSVGTPQNREALLTNIQSYGINKLKNTIVFWAI